MLWLAERRSAQAVPLGAIHAGRLQVQLSAREYPWDVVR